MAYPDFAFYTSTQIVLFLINCAVKTLTYYWGATLVLKIYHKNASFKQKLVFSIISAILLHVFIVYGFSYLNGIFQQKGELDIGGLFNILRVTLPFAYFILYLLGIHILKLSSFKSIKIMQLSYVHHICCQLASSFTGNLIFPNLPDPRGWNYLRDIFMLLSSAIIIYILYRLVYYLINRYKLYIDFSDNIIVKSIRHELAKNFGICTVFYVIVVSCHYYTQLDGLHIVLLFSLCLSYIIISISNDYGHIYKEKLANKDEHITTLNQSIDEFRGVKHDFNNILQTYSGYLAIEDYDKLKVYHKKMINTTVVSGTYLDLSQRMQENPSFFSILMNKLEDAQKRDVTFQVGLICNMENIYIDELDFSRIMSILLDNAIEAAQQTLSKQVSLTSQLKPDGSKLFILSNDTLEDINIEDLFIPGFTTKSGHMGQGLPQVRSTLHKYGNSTFNITCYKGCFTVYLELKPDTRHSKMINTKTNEPHISAAVRRS